MEPVKCRVTEVACPQDSVMLVSFQHGQLIPEKAHELKCELFSSKKTGKRVVRIAADGHVVYGGSVPTAGSEVSCNLIAIRNKRTNKVRLVPTTSVMLSPVSHVEKKSSVSLVTQEDKDRLRMKFGSKKQQRSLENYKRMHANTDALKDKLKVMIDRISVEEDHLQPAFTTSEEEGYLPPINRAAATVDDVYNLHDLVSAEELASLKDQAIKILKEPQQQMYSAFFWTTLPNMLGLGDSQQVVEGVCGLLYAELLIKFLNITMRHLRQKNALYPFSEELTSKIINKFTLQSPTGRLRPNSLRDKAVCHLIVLGLLLTKFKLDLELLSKALGTSVKRLQELSSQVGAVSSSRASSTVVLKLPLPPPKQQHLKVLKKRKK